MTRIDDEWEFSDERRKAFRDYLKRLEQGYDGRFEMSDEFRDARLAFRRRMNGSTDAETT